MTREPELFEVLYNCRAMRRLKPDPVPEALLLRLIDAANQAPSGSNLQLARWILVRDAAQKAKLAALNRAAVQTYIGSNLAGPESLPHQAARKRRRMVESVLWQAEHLHEIPALIVPCIEFPQPVERLRALMAGSSIYPAVQNLLLAARGLGLGATLTTLALLDRDAFKAALDLPANVEAYALIPVGWPLGKFGPVTRLPVEQTLRRDRW